MENLRCRIGDIAISVGCYRPENCGNVVQIIGSEGYQPWFGSPDLVFVWTVVASEERPLVYENSDGTTYARVVGPVPDKYLIPIRPDFDELETPTKLIHQEMIEEEGLDFFP